MTDEKADQQILCEKWGASYLPTNSSDKIGIAENVREGLQPINGLRHSPVDDTSGWYIWAGEDMSQNDDFFQPLHAKHLEEWHPGLKKYLGLGPGWRFLIDKDYEDVWFDPLLLTS